LATEPVKPAASAEILTGDPRWQLAKRVASSVKLRRSRRLQRLLLFTTEWALLHPQDTLHEQEIGAAVFERSNEYDTSEDTIVRVHMFQLRKRLKEYFETEGTSEPMMLDIPRGAYTPEFTVRAASEPVAMPIATEPAAPAKPWLSPVRRWIAALAILLIGIGLGWLMRPRAVEARPNLVDSFWIQMFRNRLPTEVVVADSSLSLYQEMLERNITLPEYQARQWSLLAQPIADPARRSMAQMAMVHHYTSFSETLAAHNIGVIAARDNIGLSLVFARDFEARDLENKNIILGGNMRADPWMHFFEDRLNFQYGYDDEHHFGYFRNLKPRPGEQPLYRVQWDRRGYCRVAYVPNLNNTGSVLILEGTDLSSAEAGQELVTSNEWISQLRDRLSLAKGARVPYFELFLKTDLAVDSAPRFEIAAVRVRGKG
jgi:hypothetical protein